MTFRLGREARLTRIDRLCARLPARPCVLLQTFVVRRITGCRPQLPRESGAVVAHRPRLPTWCSLCWRPLSYDFCLPSLPASAIELTRQCARHHKYAAGATGTFLQLVRTREVPEAAADALLSSLDSGHRACHLLTYGSGAAPLLARRQHPRARAASRVWREHRACSGTTLPGRDRVRGSRRLPIGEASGLLLRSCAVGGARIGRTRGRRAGGCVPGRPRRADHFRSGDFPEGAFRTLRELAGLNNDGPARAGADRHAASACRFDSG